MIEEARAGCRHAAMAVGEVVVSHVTGDNGGHVGVRVDHVTAVLGPWDAVVLNEDGASTSLTSHLFFRIKQPDQHEKNDFLDM